MREMKDSGISWIGEIPKSWSLNRLKNICATSIKDGTHQTPTYTDEDKGVPFLSSKDVTKGYIEWKDIKYITPSLHKQLEKEIKPIKNDILLAKNGTTGVAAIVDTDTTFDIYVTLAVIRVNNKIAFPKYMLYVINSLICKNQFNERLVGIGVPNLHLNIIKNTKIILPLMREQHAIVDFLDSKCSEIDELTADIEKQIDILKEYKKSVITQAVTKGLDPNVEMKDSGIAWIGMIPSKWNIGKIKFYVDKVGSGKTPKGDNTLYTKGKILFLRSQNVYNTGIILDDPPTVITDAIDKEMSNTRVITDDVLLNITGGSIGRCCIYNLEKKANVNQHVSIIRMKKDKMLSGYMHYFWVSDLGQTAINLYQTGGNREGMSASAIKNTPIPFMPIWEQQAIIDFLDSKCADIDAAIAGKQKQLDVLKEYKKSLIYEYVTGKKEVPCRE